MMPLSELAIISMLEWAFDTGYQDFTSLIGEEGLNNIKRAMRRAYQEGYNNGSV